MVLENGIYLFVFLRLKLFPNQNNTLWSFFMLRILLEKFYVQQVLLRYQLHLGVLPGFFRAGLVLSLLLALLHYSGKNQWCVWYTFSATINEGCNRLLSLVHGFWVNNYTASCFFLISASQKGWGRTWNGVSEEEEINCHSFSSLWEEMMTSLFLSIKAGLQNLAYVVGVYFHEFSGQHQPQSDRETGELNFFKYLFSFWLSSTTSVHKACGFPFIVGIANISQYQGQWAWKCHFKTPLPPKLWRAERKFLSTFFCF